MHSEIAWRVGGHGYFLAWDKKSFDEGVEKLIKRNAIKGEEELYIQEYISGIQAYLFNSSILLSQLRLN